MIYLLVVANAGKVKIMGYDGGEEKGKQSSATLQLMPFRY